jgi:hypothetical protein
MLPPTLLLALAVVAFGATFAWLAWRFRPVSALSTGPGTTARVCADHQARDAMIGSR